jgi:hypothetical protein
LNCIFKIFWIFLNKSYSAEEEDKSVTYSSPSFYLADDEKSIALIDILEYIGSKEMTFKFYLNLLQDLTNLMDEVEPSVDKTSDINSKESNILGLNTKEMEPEDLKYMQTLQNLLEMESELDESMRRVRRRMMVIRLIGLMSEDEVLKDSLLNNSGKMIEVSISSILSIMYVQLILQLPCRSGHYKTLYNY